MEKFNQEQLMLYLYGEASPLLKLAVDMALNEDPELRKEINMLKRTKKQLDLLKNNNASPSLKSINAILKYADKKKE
jgi:anti-sigma factor RsiW